MKYCSECGKEISEKAVMCPNCGLKMKGFSTDKNKWVALALWLFLGGLGGHRFYVGDSGGAMGYVLCTFFGWVLLGIPYIFMAVFLVMDLVDILRGRLADVEFDN